MAKKTAFGDPPSTLAEKVEVLAARRAVLREEVQRAETSEAMTRMRLSQALLEALAARSQAEADVRRDLLSRYVAAGRPRPDRRNRLRRRVEQLLGKLMWPGRTWVLARSGLWRSGSWGAVASLGGMAAYVLRGADPSARPSTLFDQSWYLETYPDVAAARMSPAVHYLLRGGDEGRSPHPLFDASFYARRNAGELGRTGLTPLVHFIRMGAAQGLDPHPLFSIAHYLRQAPELIGTGENPVDHYLRVGASRDLSPHPLFRPDYYRRQLSSSDEVGAALIHYLSEGSARGLKPHPLFDPAWYLERYHEAAGREPLSHFVEFAGEQMQSPGPWFDSQRYAHARGAARPQELDPLTDYLQGGAWSAAAATDGAHPVAFFTAHPELAVRGITPLEHWAEQAG